MSRLSALSLSLSLALCLALLPASVAAQEDPPGTGDGKDGEVSEGFDLMEEGAKLLLRGLTDQIEPLMDELAAEMEPKLRAFAEDFMPMLEEFSDMVGNLDDYHPPEKLPNGDIILRRKTPLEVEPPETGEVEL